MSRVLSALERETVIVFNDQEDTASISTFQRPTITKLKKNPGAKLLDEGMFGSHPWAEFEIPKEFISFRSVSKKVAA